MVEPLIGQELQGVAVEFIDYARWIISFLIVYYVIRFFTVSDADEDRNAEKEWRDRGEKYSDYINSAIRSSKDKDAARGRHLDVAVGQSALVKVLQTVDETIDAIDDVKLRIFTHKVTLLKKEIDEAMHALRSKRAKIPAAKLDVNVQLAVLQTQRGVLVTAVLAPAIMPTTDAELTARSVRFKTKLKNIRSAIAPVLVAVQDYVKGP